MWPWEHLAFGYLLFSLYSHARWSTGPTGRTAGTVAVATQIPDLIDKPFGWWLGVLPGGRTFAHSLLTAIPSIALVAIAGWFLHANRAAVAFAVGYLSHIAGDVIYPLVVEGELATGFLLWPITGTDAETTAPVGHIAELIADFAAFLMTSVGVVYLVVEILLLSTAIIVWWRDDAPGLDWFRRRATTPRVDSP